MAYFVYILKSMKDGRYYIGSTSNVESRLAYHNSGRQRSTKSRTPFVLVKSEEYPDRQAAERREREIKSYKGGEGFRKVIGGV
ncbi:MAG TPA: GIY-YIG nuclease family protein [Bacteroidales bacterium]|nr:GIY-YIG nuclease family protein [Bacteroidales bacterium]